MFSESTQKFVLAYCCKIPHMAQYVTRVPGNSLAQSDTQLYSYEKIVLSCFIKTNIPLPVAG